MERPRNGHRDVLREARRFEPRLARALAKAFGILQDRTLLVPIINALAAKNVNAVLRLVAPGMEEVMRPSGAIVADATIKGGKVGAWVVNDVIA